MPYFSSFEAQLVEHAHKPIDTIQFSSPEEISSFCQAVESGLITSGQHLSIDSKLQEALDELKELRDDGFNLYVGEGITTKRFYQKDQGLESSGRFIPAFTSQRVLVAAEDNAVTIPNNELIAEAKAEFKSLIIDTIKVKIKQLSEMTKEQKEEYISKFNKAKDDKAALVKAQHERMRSHSEPQGEARTVPEGSRVNATPQWHFDPERMQEAFNQFNYSSNLWRNPVFDRYRQAFPFEQSDASHASRMSNLRDTLVAIAQEVEPLQLQQANSIESLLSLLVQNEHISRSQTGSTFFRRPSSYTLLESDLNNRTNSDRTPFDRLCLVLNDSGATSHNVPSLRNLLNHINRFLETSSNLPSPRRHII
jgi:hypothetical protein